MGDWDRRLRIPLRGGNHLRLPLAAFGLHGSPVHHVDDLNLSFRTCLGLPGPGAEARGVGRWALPRAWGPGLGPGARGRAHGARLPPRWSVTVLLCL